MSFVSCTTSQNILEISYEYYGDEMIWNRFFSYDDEAFVFSSRPAAVILPHHLITVESLVKFYKGMSDTFKPSVIVIIGPNHYENADANIQTCLNCVYKSPSDIDVFIDSDLSKKIVKDGIAKFEDDTFINEHAIFAHTPLIAKYFPDVKILPILLQWEMPVDEVLDLSNWLDENLPDDALLIASVDFSHYQPNGVSDFHDQSSFASIVNFDFDNIYDLELDSPSSIYALLNFAEKRGYMNSKRFAHTNLYQFLSVETDETTSHHFFAFFEGEINPYKGVSIESVGAIYDDFDLGVVDDWDWDRSFDESKDDVGLRFLRDLKGVEDRFLVGSDFLVFDIEEEGCFVREQNFMSVSFCKFSENFDFDEAVEIVELQDSDIVYLLFEFEEIGGGGDGGDGGENSVLDYSKQSQIARRFVDAGVDVFVGRGISEVLPLDLYDGALVFLSLGDFVGENVLNNKVEMDLGSLSNDLEKANSEGAVLGLYVSSDFYYVYNFPVNVVGAYPVLKGISERVDFFGDDAENQMLRIAR